MASNTKLTRERAVQLIRGKYILCPACGKAELVPRYANKLQHTEFICKACKEVFPTAKQI